MPYTDDTPCGMKYAESPFTPSSDILDVNTALAMKIPSGGRSNAQTTAEFHVARILIASVYMKKTTQW
jgi:hypothetical protein